MDYIEANLVAKKLRRDSGVKEAQVLRDERGEQYVEVLTTLHDVIRVRSIEEMTRLLDAMAEGRV